MAIWQLCANLLIPNCLRSNLSYSPLAALELYVKKTNFVFVPNQDFNRSYSDEDLYKKYNLTEDEVAYIERLIRPME